MTGFACRAAIICASLLLGSISPLLAQPPAPVNLYVANVTYDGGAIRVGAPRKLTGDRGINSQPSFTPDGKAILFVSRRDLVTHDTSMIARALAGRLIHAWTPRGTILMGKGNAVFAMTPPMASWVQVASFGDPELQDVNTYVVSPAGDRLIIISPVRPAAK